MGTNSTIAVKCKDGMIRKIYCHFDGYLDHNGKMLLNHYNNQDLAEALVMMGNASSINETLDACKFYGGNNEQPDLYKTIEDYTRSLKRWVDDPTYSEYGYYRFHSKYNYYFDGECWLINGYELALKLK